VREEFKQVAMATLGTCFAVASLKLWNGLPAGLRQMDIDSKQFKRLLNLYEFGH